MFSVLNNLNLHKVLKSVDLFEFVCNWRNPPMHLRSIRPIVLKFQKCWIFNGLDQRYAIVHSRVSFIKSIFFFSFSKSLCYFGHLKCIYWICYIHMLFCYSLQKKSHSICQKSCSIFVQPSWFQRDHFWKLRESRRIYFSQSNTFRLILHQYSIYL